MLWGVLGLVVGGILNVLISRLPYWGGLLAAPLHCHYCQEPLRLTDAVPLWGYAGQRGRCRQCGHTLSPRFPLVELVTAALFGLAYHRFGLTLETVVFSFYLAVLVIIFTIDLEHRLILNVVTYPVALVSLGLAALLPGVGLGAALSGALAYGGFFVLLYVLSVLMYRRADALGLGDVKLAIVIGLMTGLPLSLVALLAGVLLGALSALVVLLGGRSARSAMPYGTSLSVGAMLAILYGDQILRWYIGQ